VGVVQRPSRDAPGQRPRACPMLEVAASDESPGFHVGRVIHGRGRIGNRVFLLLETDDLAGDLAQQTMTSVTPYRWGDRVA